jgi:hypothetical protein
MKQRLSTCSQWFLLLAVFSLATTSIVAQTPSRSRPISLDGPWRIDLDPADAGLKQEWFKRRSRGSIIRLPGILQSREFGSPISTSTPWVLSLYDRFWYLREEYKAYTERAR